MSENLHYTAKIFLYEIEPLIWRRVSFPADSTFEELHDIIQKAMGWGCEQGHEFLHGKGKKLDQIIGSLDNDHAKSSFFQNEQEVKVLDFMGRRRFPLRILYRYDFYEEWIHEIVIESKFETSSNSAVLLEGERACPPENSGGAKEYSACLAGESEWFDPEYDPELFDVSKVSL